MSANLSGELVKLLSDGELHSGPVLARNLQCTRTAVWKHVSKLRSMGLEIETSRGNGYQIRRGVELLEHDCIFGHLRKSVTEHLDSIEIYSVTDSTSERLRARPAPSAGRMQVAFAEFQTGGRGRRGRQWFSPYASGLCLSVSWAYDQAPPALSGLSLAAGIAVLRAMAPCRPANLGLKWPNDLVADGRKLAGLLVDVEGETTGPIKVIVGVGVNFVCPDELKSKLRNASGMLPIGLDEVAQNWPVSRNELGAAIVDSLFAAMTAYGSDGFASVADIWKDYDCLTGKQISVQRGDRVFSGIAQGVAADGSLQMTVDGELVSLASGEVTVRAGV